ncbi:MAG: hypothetical protein J0I20_33835 [Chloroflexi bacterium]|nr:hypothetical protein [Chloroflexota bacterium]OJW05556.1 MAG: hypothetical protein BGO39_02765 [Chloroflexi bacterium 54-19]
MSNFKKRLQIQEPEIEECKCYFTQGPFLILNLECQHHQDKLAEIFKLPAGVEKQDKLNDFYQEIQLTQELRESGLLE